MMRRTIFWTLGLAAVAAGAIFVARTVAPCAKPLAVLEKIGLPGTQACADRAAALRDRAAGPLPPAVTVTQAANREFVDRLFVSGTLVARDEAMVGAQLDGLRITELLADDGDRVTKGQVLARLDRSQIDTLVAQNDAALLRADAAIAQATNQIGQFEAVLAQTEADLDRARKLDVKIITQATLDQRTAAFRTAQSQLAVGKSALAVAKADKASREAERRELMVRLDRTEVKAPVAGLISRRTARLGAVAMAASDALFRIVTDGAIDFEAEIPEDALARLKLGMRTEIALPGVDAKTEGRIRLISEEVDKATRLGKVRIALPPGAPARIGSFASGTAIVSRRSGVGVPASAIQKNDDGDFVQVVKNDRIEIRRVMLGITTARMTETREGLASGEVVVTRAAAFLRPGDMVRPIAAEAKAASVEREASK
jgi:RND family efflux transporter MFP subunit